MNRKRQLSGMIALNLVLVVLIALATLAPNMRAADAGGEGATAAGDYVMVGGRVTGVTGNALYVLDQRSGVLVALKYDLGAKKMKGISVRNVTRDAAKAGPGR